MICRLFRSKDKGNPSSVPLEQHIGYRNWHHMNNKYGKKNMKLHHRLTTTKRIHGQNKMKHFSQRKTSLIFLKQILLLIL